MQKGADGGVPREQLIIAACQRLAGLAQLLSPEAEPPERTIPALWPGVRGHPLRGGVGSILGHDAGKA